MKAFLIFAFGFALGVFCAHTLPQWYAHAVICQVGECK